MGNDVQVEMRGDINVSLTALINAIPEESLPAVIEKLGSEGTINSEEVNTKFLLIA